MSHLFSTIAIRNHNIKNRVVMPPMVNFGFPRENGCVTEEHVKHYTARAKGGVGLIIIEATCVNPKGRLSAGQLGLWSDDQISGFSKIGTACHKEGATVLVQIHHAGLAAAPGVTSELLAPSDFSGQSRYGRTPISARALTLNEIHAIQKDFVAAAVRAQKAGLDGIELHGAHGYLISQFLSPLVNKRDDAYGGSLIKRTRFVNEIIAAIREATGDNFIIDCRMGGYEPDLESGIKIAGALEKSGVDLLHVSFGMESFLKPESGESQPVPQGFNYSNLVYCGSEIKRNVKIPVIVVNGIRTPSQANYLIENGLADFTAIGKGLLVDPEWANKAQRNLEVIACIDCKVCSYFRPDAVCPQIKPKKQAAQK